MLDIDAARLPAGVEPTREGVLRNVADVRRRLRSGVPAKPLASTPPADTVLRSRIAAPVGPDPMATFNALIRGPCNAHAIRMAESFMRGEVGEVLYIRGPVGSGKTALLKAIHQAISCRAVDDVGSRPHAALAALRAGGPVVLADMAAPVDLPDAMLGTRCASAMPLVLSALDEASALVMAEDFCARLRMANAQFLPSDQLLRAIAATPGINGHTVRGAIYAALSAHVSGKPYGLTDIPPLMAELCVVHRSDGRVRIESVLAVVCEAYRIPRTDLLSQRRAHSVVKPRQIAMYLAKTLTFRSLPQIGRAFCGRDHTTILHAVRKIDALVKADAAFAAEVEALATTIREGVR